MSRYLARTDAQPIEIERLPKGTKRTEGQTFKQAKNEVLAFLRETRDKYARAAKVARRLSPTKLSLSDVWEDESETETENVQRE